MSVNRQAKALANVEQDIEEIQEDVEDIAEDVEEIQEDMEEIADEDLLFEEDVNRQEN